MATVTRKQCPNWPLCEKKRTVAGQYMKKNQTTVDRKIDVFFYVSDDEFVDVSQDIEGKEHTL